MKKGVMYVLVLLQAIFFVYASDNCVLSYNNVRDEHKAHIEEGIRTIFPCQSLVGSVNPLYGGGSGDGLYTVKIDSFKCVFRCIKQPHSVELCRKDCIYSQMAAEKGLGPKILYQNVEKGCYAIEFIEGVYLSSTHLEDKLTLEQFAAELRTIHNTSIDSQVEFDIFGRIEQKIESVLQKHPEFSLELSTCLDEVHKIKTVVKKHMIVPKTCHNDIHSMNLFYAPENTINFIDWGNAGLGDPFWDLACSSVKLHFSKDQRDFFLEKYFENNCTSFDRAHFIFMENIVLWEVWLYYLGMKQNIANKIVKSDVFNYFSKINEEITGPTNTFKDLAKICFDLIQKRIQSPEYKEAISLLEQL